MAPSDDRLRAVFNAVEAHIERRYGIPVRIRDVPHPFTGDLDGAEIHVDHAVTLEEAVFIIAHLFGHTVQWNLSAAAREIGHQVPVNPSPEVLARIREYELEACGYSAQLFHEAGVRDLDQWLSDFAACDLAYLDHFYRTREKLPFRSFWSDGQPLVTPLAIPAFRPTRWVSRWEGIVV
jgi:hypothetical protein